MTRRSRRRFLKDAALAAGACCAGRTASAQGPTPSVAPPKRRTTHPAGCDRRVLNPWRLEPVDLRRFIKLGVQHIYEGAIDRRRGCLPFVRFNLTEPPTWCNHEYWGSPHMVGRFLDALALCRTTVEMPDDDDAVVGLTKLLHDSLDNPWHLPFDTLPDPKGRRSANMHHCREVLLALVALHQWRNCRRSLELARGLVRAMDRATKETGRYPAHMLYEDGWGKPEPGWINYTTGRAITALVTYYEASEDGLAIELAKRFADDNIAQTFTPDGRMTDAAGRHLHSTEGTMAGLLYLARHAGWKTYGEMGRRLYDSSLRKWRSSWGWAKESRSYGPGRGEANNTGDFIESALLLAGGPRCPRATYFADAERFIRNGLLASQVVRTDWIHQSDAPDTPDEVHSDIRRRARGAFAFTTPNGYHSYNTDLMGGALRALCKTLRDGIAYGPQRSRPICVNLLFPRKMGKALTLRSWLPERGRLEVDTRTNAHVEVRLPEGVDPSSVRVGPPSELKAVPTCGSYVPLPQGPSNEPQTFRIEFDQPDRRTEEKLVGRDRPYEVTWRGETVVGMEPTEGPIALY